MTRQDERLAGVPMRPVSCGRCGAGVLVRKSSWQQTSVQWDAAARGRCEERRAAEAGPAAAPGTGFEGCEALRGSIREAALSGALTVPEE